MGNVRGRRTSLDMAWFNRACIISGTWLHNAKRRLLNALNFLQSRAWHNPCRWTASQNNHRLEHVCSEHFTSRCDHLTQFRKKPLDDFRLTLMTLVYIKRRGKEEKGKETRMFDGGEKYNFDTKRQGITNVSDRHINVTFNGL